METNVALCVMCCLYVACVLCVSLWVGGEQDKQEAKDTYDDAIAAGDTAVLVEQDERSADLFSCSLGNLAPHESAEIVLSYVTSIPVEADADEQQKLRFSVPLSIYPRYDPDAAHTHPLPTAPMLRHLGSGSGSGTSASHVPQELSVRIHKSAVRGEVSCLTHSMERAEEGEYEVYQASGSAVSFEEDLVMMIPYGSGRDLTMYVARAGEGAQAGDKATVMLSYAPTALLREFDNDATSEVVFVIDCSGSMRGARIQQAKQTLISCLAGLPEGCLFNIVRFGSTHHSLYPASREMTDATKAEAMRFTEQMDADLGGTEILAPLEQLMSKPPQQLPRSIFVLTDGAVSNVSAVQDCCRKDHLQHGTK